MEKSDLNVANEIIFDLQDRIDEAIEYIENKNKYLDDENYYQVFEYRNLYLMPLLDILKGSDKELILINWRLLRTEEIKEVKVESEGDK